MTRRLLLSYLSVAVFVLLLLELPLAIFFEQREMDRLTADVERDATVLASIYEDTLEAGTPADPVPAADYTLRTNARVVVVDSAGISVVDSAAATDRDFSTRPEFEVALTGSRSVGTRQSETLGIELLYVAVPVASGGNVHGALRLTLDTHEVTEQVHRFWLGLAAVAFVVLAAVGAMGWAVARWLTRPIRHLQTTAARFADGDLTRTEPDPASPEELIVLEETMNTMARRLDRLLSQQREFVADASHQLRTPLTGLRLRLENLQYDAEDPEQVGELDRAIDETDRLAALVSDLLLLARAEESPSLTIQDLAQLVDERVDTWTAVADQTGITLDLTAPRHPTWVKAVAGGVEQILDNIIDNAIKASPPDSTICITIAHEHDLARLVVSDAGRGLDRAQKSQALDRFWRGDTTTPGTGLGLAIVESLARASGGNVHLTDSTPTGLTVTVTLPNTAPLPESGQEHAHPEVTSTR